jgi:geranylgeranyl diphosphate synthase type II
MVVATSLPKSLRSIQNKIIMKTFSQYITIAQESIKSLSLPAGELSGLYAPIEYALDAGGKRLRPVMLMMAADAFGKECSDDAKDAAIGIEMFHNFTLLHDDVMDHSDTRRGRPTVHVKWNENTAILSGDTMLTLATQYVSKVADGLLRPVLDAFNHTAIEVYEGQQRDVDFETCSDVSLPMYLEMIRQKTGALLGGAAKIGALVGGASAEDADRLLTFGEKLGIAFQIQDDFLDVYGDPATFGKPIGGDINNNKKTFLLINALKRDTSGKLSEAMSLPCGAEKVNAVRNLMTAYGIPALCDKAIIENVNEALEALNNTSMTEAGKTEFKALALKLVGRKY